MKNPNIITEVRGRKVQYENAMCKAVGLICTCNACDRIIYEDENYLQQYIESGGYCRECNEENNFNNDLNMTT